MVLYHTQTHCSFSKILQTLTQVAIQAQNKPEHQMWFGYLRQLMLSENTNVPHCLKRFLHFFINRHPLFAGSAIPVLPSVCLILSTCYTHLLITAGLWIIFNCSFNSEILLSCEDGKFCTMSDRYKRTQKYFTTRIIHYSGVYISQTKTFLCLFLQWLEDA